MDDTRRGIRWRMTSLVLLVMTYAAACTGDVPELVEDVGADAACCEGDLPRVVHDADESPDWQVVRADYRAPDVVLRDRDGKEVRLLEVLEPGEGVVLLDFVFTTCSTICPVMTATFSTLQGGLADLGRPVRLVSISIDPQFDTPEVLRGYAERVGARPGWTFLTGTPDDVDAVVRAFDCLSRSKMGHRPFTYVAIGGTPGWTRYEGLAGAAPLEAAVRAALASGP